MDKNRLEAFSDGVIAIILTIMVLELKVPKGHGFDALAEAWPVFGAYALSYWNVFLLWLNHHNIFAPLQHVNHPLLVANGLLLFVASLIPFVTAFASESHWTEPVPVFLYGVVMACVSAAFVRLRLVARAAHHPAAGQPDAHAFEVRASVLMGLGFLAGSGVAWLAPRASLVGYALVPLVLMLTRQRRRLAARQRGDLA